MILDKISNFLKKDYESSVLACGFLINPYNFVDTGATRGIFGGGHSLGEINTIDYITIATTGNAIDFGDMSVTIQQVAAVGSSTRGIFGGGYASSGGNNNVIDYVTIATTGNATDFGDLTQAKYNAGGTQNGL